ncbi:MAG: hypothetical protein Q7Q71_07975 [Verrucomicrobiota bacterium JB023]|nr:hypothetical protein [Verrucomicrobiota bacterium JB023]
MKKAASDEEPPKSDEKEKAANQTDQVSESPAKPSSDEKPSPEKTSKTKEASSAPEKKATIEVVEEGKAESDKGSAQEASEPSDQSGDNDEGKKSNRRGRSRRGGRSGEERNRDSSDKKKFDPEEVAEKAWLIYQGELEEEGVSLIDPRRGREIARRCFELAVVFCEERERFSSQR